MDEIDLEYKKKIKKTELDFIWRQRDNYFPLNVKRSEYPCNNCKNIFYSLYSFDKHICNGRRITTRLKRDAE